MYDLKHYKEQDDSFKKKLKRKIKGFSFVLLLTLISMGTCAFSYVSENNLKKNSIDGLISDALLTDVKEEAYEKYKKAVLIDPQREDTFRSIYDYVMADNILDKDEDVFIRTLFSEATKNGTVDEEFKLNNRAYSDFAYDIAMAYWYYYENNIKNYRVATRWFDNVTLYDKNNEECVKKYNNAVVYSKIGSYYSLLGSVNLAGDNQVGYKEYLNDLYKLLKSGEENVITSLYLRKEILCQITENANELSKENMNAKTLYGIIDKVEEDNRKSKNPTDLEIKLYDEVKGLIPLARESVKSLDTVTDDKTSTEDKENAE